LISTQVANTILELDGGALTRFDGDYAAYAASKRDLAAALEGRRVDGVAAIKAADLPDADALDAAAAGTKGKGKGKGKAKFGGKAPGVSGRKDKGVKNAKRMA